MNKRAFEALKLDASEIVIWSLDIDIHMEDKASGNFYR